VIYHDFDGDFTRENNGKHGGWSWGCNVSFCQLGVASWICLENWVYIVYPECMIILVGKMINHKIPGYIVFGQIHFCIFL
jgi:hypothetical protein